MLVYGASLDPARRNGQEPVAGAGALQLVLVGSRCSQRMEWLTGVMARKVKLV